MASAGTMLRMHHEFSDVFNGIECFKGTFSLQIKDDAKPYQALLRHVVYALNDPFKKELERLQDHQILTPLGVDKMAQWYNCYVIVPKPNSTVYLCVDPARFSQALISPVHRGPTLDDILPKLTNVYYMTIIDASSGYRNLKLSKIFIFKHVSL